MSGWKDEKLGNLVRFRAGTGFPKHLQGAMAGELPFAKVSDMNRSGNEITLGDAENYISYEQAKSLKAYIHRPGAIAFAKIGVALTSNRRRRIVRPLVLDNNMMSAEPLEEKLDPKFSYFLLSTIDFNEVSAGSALPYLTISGLSDIDVFLPPLAEQREIAAILGALDDKIEVNRKTAATLEAMARALYRSWFVDFDPVWAKLEGRAPTHMDPAIAALFPDSFGDDGLPEGWEWLDLAEFYDVLETGKRPKGGIQDTPEGVPSIGAESIKNIGVFDYAKTKRIPRDFFETMRKGRLSDGDILVYKDGGKPGELRPAVTYVSEGFPFEEACINEHVFRVRLSSELGQHFGFLALSSKSCMDQMRELATGVAQPGLNQSAMNALSFVRPDRPEILISFNALVKPLLDGCNVKANESRTLATLRDSLLPRLMSGELRVGEAREQIEEVA
ncbi:restriction endonuclease subunit S [Cereibacter sphaeroides]|uniref:restriction endonuclease subunit S n=1 Tax=Cereibacter sphaeroides TaxID=1063 RepID=UPI003FCCA9EB